MVDEYSSLAEATSAIDKGFGESPVGRLPG
jgi:hypothetical protein